MIDLIGWIPADKAYDYFLAADLICFPGQHSVLWEQATAQGLPMICKLWEGTTHVDLGGNVLFLNDDTIEEIEKEITHLLSDKKAYLNMKRVAMEKGRKVFSYLSIAAQSIGDLNDTKNE